MPSDKIEFVSSNLLYKSGVQVLTGSGTLEQTLDSFNLPPYIITPTQGIRIVAWGVSAANNNNKTWRLKFGATTLIAGPTDPNNALRWRLSAEILYRSASVQTVIAEELQANASGWNNELMDNTAPAEDDTLSILISVTGQDAVDSAGDITLDGWFIKVIE